MEISKEVYSSKKRNGFFINFILILGLLSGVINVATTLFFNNDSLDFYNNLVVSLLLFIFSVIFTYMIISNFNKKKLFIIISSTLLILINTINILSNTSVFVIPAFNKVIDFTNYSLVDVVEWSSDNKIDLEQDYEFSDMIDEYHIINQDVKVGTNIKDISSLGVAISQGPNPDKEIIVPNMMDWSSEKVIDFIEDNYLNNVEIEFVTSDRASDTVIEQNTSGNMKRSDLLKLSFSVGEEFDGEVKLIDFTKMSTFESEFFLKRYNLKYKFDKDFFNDIDKNLIGKQSVEPGTMVNKDSEEIVLTVSKGEEIKLPDFKKMSIEDITNYIVSNKLKIEFIYRFDDSVKKDDIISANYEKDDKVEEGTTIKITISKGSLNMKDFNNIDEFYDWANKYGIKYETKNEFNKDVKIGEVIKYSHKNGDIIKNDDVIVIYISDGEELKVPNVVGITKGSAASKLKDIGLSYNYVYKYSSSVKKDNVISQSISSGSLVSNGTTITLTISKGKKPTSTGGSNNNQSSGNNNSGNKPTPPPVTPTCDKSITTLVWAAAGNTGSGTMKALKANYPKIKWNFNLVVECSNGSKSSGTICNASAIDGKHLNHCDTYSVTIVE